MADRTEAADLTAATFEAFVAVAEIRVRRALVATAGPEAAKDAVADGGGPERVGSFVAPTASETANADLLAPGEARGLPPAPVEGRFDAATVWTGTEVFLWGGTDERRGRDFADGATFDVGRGEWRLLPTGPLSARGGASAVWTGTEVLVWGGFGGKGRADGAGPERSDGAAYDPTTRTWRVLADAPVTDDGFARAVWTGGEMIVLTGRDPATAAAYDPVEDSWRRIAAPPRPLTPSHPQVLWTGDRVVAQLGAAGLADDVGLYTYDPIADRWDDEGRPSGAAPSDRLVWAGDRLLRMSVDRAPEVRDPVTGRWATAGDPPPPVVATTRQAPWAVWTGQRVAVWNPGFVAAFDPGSGTWTVTGRDRQPTDSAAGASLAWADGVLFVWGGFPSVGEGLLVRPADPAATASTELQRWSECGAEAPVAAPARGAEPALGGDAVRFGSTMADGRAYQVAVTGAGIMVGLGGVPAGPPIAGPITTGTVWSEVGADGPNGRLGLVVGVRPPGAVRTMVVDERGVARCEGIAHSPDGRWFAMPDVDRHWLVVHQDAEGDDVIDPGAGSGPCTADGVCPGR